MRSSSDVRSVPRQRSCEHPTRTRSNLRRCPTWANVNLQILPLAHRGIFPVLTLARLVIRVQLPRSPGFLLATIARFPTLGAGQSVCSPMWDRGYGPGVALQQQGHVSARLLYRKPTDMLVNGTSLLEITRTPRGIRADLRGNPGGYGQIPRGSRGGSRYPHWIRRRIPRSGAGGTRRRHPKEITRIYAGILDGGRIRRLVSSSGKRDPAGSRKSRWVHDKAPLHCLGTVWGAAHRVDERTARRAVLVRTPRHYVRWRLLARGKSSRRACPQSIVCLT